MDQDKLKSIVESILFVSGEPVKISRLAKVSGAARPEVENALMALQNDYARNRGMVIIKKEDEVQMATSPENAETISELVKSEIQENLSRSALETLSIVAYRGPMTRADIEAIRGVNCSFTLRSLLMRGLLERIDNPENSRGYLYKISFEFLKKMGVDSVEKLPDWESLSKDARIENIISE
ncbi:MAG: SMC-Scp complex subunit ScpB [Candidatus Moranbacteria bacterium RIFOXYA12_FULL_44_15]|nr:MAG: SMC-Scp complex subunit ScpB [Candidatus Moranbacteria bacterium RIFOXYA12_FULL_44_15]